jgi:hypothetical protein
MNLPHHPKIFNQEEKKKRNNIPPKPLKFSEFRLKCHVRTVIALEALRRLLTVKEHIDNMVICTGTQYSPRENISSFSPHLKSPKDEAQSHIIFSLYNPHFSSHCLHIHAHNDNIKSTLKNIESLLLSSKKTTDEELEIEMLAKYPHTMREPVQEIARVLEEGIYQPSLASAKLVSKKGHNVITKESKREKETLRSRQGGGLGRVRERPEVEEDLMQEYPQIVPLSAEVQPVVNQQKDGTYGSTMMGRALYSTGYALTGRSTKYPFGLLYNDKKGNIFSIGYFRKQHENTPAHRAYLFISAPRGPNAVNVVFQFCNEIKEKGIISDSIYLRHITPAQREILLKRGCTEITKENAAFFGWHDDAYKEDETYCHGKIRIDDVIIFPGQEYEYRDAKRKKRKSIATDVVIPTLPVSLFPKKERPSQSGRGKNRKRWNNFRNWLTVNKCSFYTQEFFPCEPTKIDIVQRMIQKHFESLRLRKKDIGSTPEDYEALYRMFTLPGIDLSLFFLI